VGNFINYMSPTRRKAAFTLKDILNNYRTIDLILDSAQITKRTDRESSFCAYGDFKRYEFTLPLEEEPECCFGESDTGGMVYTKEGYGLWIPEYASKIVYFHTHPSFTTAIPSTEDLEFQLGVISKNWDGSPYHFFNPVSIVGHYTSVDKTVRLFIGQFVLPTEKTSWERWKIMNQDLPARLDSLVRQQIGDQHLEFDFSDLELPEKAARVLNSTGRYAAQTLSFPINKEFEYWDKVENWKGFPLLALPFTYQLKE